jgi:alpha-L-fucosidase
MTVNRSVRIFPALAGFLLAAVLLIDSSAAQQKLYVGNALVAPGESLEDIVRKAASIVPTPRQMAWQKQEIIAFIHFGLNTFTGAEWGTGKVDQSIFDPVDLDARSWVRALKAAGVKTVIVTAKHHDGFCLWPSKYTDYSVRTTPWKNGKGDVVGDVAAACREMGLGLGIYLSPWDRHEPCYGDSPRYNEHFRQQLAELLSDYGPVTEVWFDGANGEGPNGKRQVYDWASYYALIRKLQPKAVIAICGPDVRWVGTESGYGRDTEWSVVPATLLNQDSIAAGSQQTVVDGAFIPRDMVQEDLGAREKLLNARALVWYPAETNFSIRPGWFYHSSQDDHVKSPEKLVDIYYSSVGKNGVMLVNVPPDTRGLFHPNDVKSLAGMKLILDRTFKENLAAGAVVSASSETKGHRGISAIDRSPESCWIPHGEVTTGWLELALPEARSFDRALLQEDIRLGQHVEHFHLEAWNGSRWDTIARGSTIGYKRLLRFAPVTARRVRLVVDAARRSPAISNLALYKAPAQVSFTPEGGGFADTLNVEMRADRSGVEIHYTMDGSDPVPASPVYAMPVCITHPVTIRAYAAPHGERGVTFQEARFIKSQRVASVSLAHASSEKYRASGSTTLVDGRRGLVDPFDRDWLGFEGDSLVATIDLGKRVRVAMVTAGFLQNQESWIFLPIEVMVEVSVDGMAWTRAGGKELVLEAKEAVVARDITVEIPAQEVRFVRVSAANVGTCPTWHPAAGGKAWLFVDEIIVE